MKRLLKVLASVGRAFFPKLDFPDVCVAAGLALLGVGIWWIFPPASLIAVGAILLLFGIRGWVWASSVKR